MLTFRFPLDELPAPYVAAYVPSVLISGTEFLNVPDAQVVDEGWCGVLVTASGQCLLNCLGIAEREPCWALGKRNAVYTLRQGDTGLMYASVQPGQLLEAILPHQPDGGALGSLVPYAHSRARLTHEVRQVRDQIGNTRSLHVFGVGHPDTIRAVMQVDATSMGSCSSQLDRERADNLSPPEDSGWPSVTSSVPWTPHDPSTRAGQYATANVVILTPERLNLLTRRDLRRRWRRCVELTIVDELHLLNHPEWGATLEETLTRLRLACPTLRVLELTATCGKPLEVAH